jgi:cysteinyl-tRNA synthetase
MDRFMSSVANAEHPTPVPDTIRVYNTLTKTKQVLEPVTPGRIGIYLCGPTVYDKAHIGHMVGPVIFDAIKRYLVYCGYDVTWVVNITDVDDKLINKARQRGISMAQVAEENTADYLANLRGLGVDQIDHMPKATENIEEIIRFIQDLIDRGFAYQSGGDVFLMWPKTRSTASSATARPTASRARVARRRPRSVRPAISRCGRRPNRRNRLGRVPGGLDDRAGTSSARR